jgi:hypothetical protein
MAEIKPIERRVAPGVPPVVDFPDLSSAVASIGQAIERNKQARSALEVSGAISSFETWIAEDNSSAVMDQDGYFDSDAIKEKAQEAYNKGVEQYAAAYNLDPTTDPDIGLSVNDFLGPNAYNLRDRMNKKIESSVSGIKNKRNQQQARIALERLANNYFQQTTARAFAYEADSISAEGLRQEEAFMDAGDFDSALALHDELFDKRVFNREQYLSQKDQIQKMRDSDKLNRFFQEGKENILTKDGKTDLASLEESTIKFFSESVESDEGGFSEEEAKQYIRGLSDEKARIENRVMFQKTIAEKEYLNKARAFAANYLQKSLDGKLSAEDELLMDRKIAELANYLKGEDAVDGQSVQSIINLLLRARKAPTSEDDYTEAEKALGEDIAWNLVDEAVQQNMSTDEFILKLRDATLGESNKTIPYTTQKELSKLYQASNVKSELFNKLEDVMRAQKLGEEEKAYIRRRLSNLRSADGFTMEFADEVIRGSISISLDDFDNISIPKSQDRDLYGRTGSSQSEKLLEATYGSGKVFVTDRDTAEPFLGMSRNKDGTVLVKKIEGGETIFDDYRQFDELTSPETINAISAFGDTSIVGTDELGQGYMFRRLGNTVELPGGEMVFPMAGFQLRPKIDENGNAVKGETEWVEVDTGDRYFGLYYDEAEKEAKMVMIGGMDPSDTVKATGIYDHPITMTDSRLKWSYGSFAESATEDMNKPMGVTERQEHNLAFALMQTQDKEVMRELARRFGYTEREPTFLERAGTFSGALFRAGKAAVKENPEASLFAAPASLLFMEASAYDKFSSFLGTQGTQE